MSNVNNSNNMTLPIPIVGVEFGPQYAIDVDACFTIIDAHDHTPGLGVPITPGGMNINVDLPMNVNNIINLRSVRFTSQPSPLALVTDIGTLYESGVDLYYNDGAGNQVRLTQSGGVAGSPGSITGLVSPATVSYSVADLTYVFQSAANTSAILDAGSIILRNATANSKGLTLQAPLAMGADYTIVLPTLPVSQKIVTLDAAGNMVAAYSLDNTTIQVSSGIIGLTSAIQQQLQPSGSITAYGGAAAPTGWLICDGSAVSRVTYATLFAAIGVAYGYGDNSTTFNVPDLRGQFLRGVSGASANDPNKTTRTAMNTGGNTGNNVGSVQAQATAKNGMTIADPGHTHGVHQGTSVDVGALTGFFYDVSFAPPNSRFALNLDDSAGPIAAALIPATTGITLNAGDAETRPINAYVNYIIKT